jgi:DNA-binding LacI/PurR family transcriptional regulator
VAERVTVQTIADALGVPRTTVSNAYNRPDQLAPELRKKVLETAKQLGRDGARLPRSRPSARDNSRAAGARARRGAAVSR